MKRFAALAGAIFVAGCAEGGILVRQADYGEQWPFTIAEGRLQCYSDGPRKHVVLDNGKGIQYGINGSARGAGGFPDSNSIMKPGMVGVHLQPFIDRGLTLCK